MTAADDAGALAKEELPPPFMEELSDEEQEQLTPAERRVLQKEQLHLGMANLYLDLAAALVDVWLVGQAAAYGLRSKAANHMRAALRMRDLYLASIKTAGPPSSRTARR